MRSGRRCCSARAIAAASLIGAALGLGSILPGYLAQGEACRTDCYRLYQKNLLSRAWPRYPLADDIIASNAAFVTLQEVSAHNLKFMRTMFETYPSKVICPYQLEKSVAVLSMYPTIAGTAECGETAGLALMQVDLPDGQRIWIVALHLDWPFPFSQPAQVDEVVARLAALTGPIVVGGDFNMVPWGATVRRISHTARSQRLGPYRPTYPKFGWLLPLPIDHVLVPEGSTGITKAKNLHGSDHMGIVADFSLP